MKKPWDELSRLHAVDGDSSDAGGWKPVTPGSSFYTVTVVTDQI